MNARAWFEEALDAEARAIHARTAAERQRHARNAVDSLLAASTLGHSGALLKLGFYYQHGQFGILPARMDLAEHWYRLGIAANDSGCMFALATLLMRTGRQPEGRRWLRKALAHGEGGAACHLARELEDNSPSRALRLYLQGASLGDPFAAYRAGEMLEARGDRGSLLRAETLFKQAVKTKLLDSAEKLERVRQKLKAVAPSRSRVARQRTRRR
jgi:TPR repeat protein